MSDDLASVREEFAEDLDRLAAEVVRLRAELADLRARQIVPLRRRPTVAREPQIGFRLR